LSIANTQKTDKVPCLPEKQNSNNSFSDAEYEGHLETVVPDYAYIFRFNHQEAFRAKNTKGSTGNFTNRNVSLQSARQCTGRNQLNSETSSGQSTNRSPNPKR
jgi:hypothetical protein